MVKEIWPEKEKYTGLSFQTIWKFQKRRNTRDEVFKLFGNLRDFVIAAQCCHNPGGERDEPLHRK